MKVHKHHFHNSQEAWAGLNEWLFLKDNKLRKIGQGATGGICNAYSVWVHIQDAWVDPEFDFAKVFGHRIAKWTHLVRNYVDMNYLDLVKNEVTDRERKKQQQYNITMHFTNSHNSGKDCLISLTFSRRFDYDIPILTFHVRASEVTKRLLWDFLLVQRLGEYVYGKNMKFSIIFYSPMVYIQAETFLMYDIYKPLDKLASKVKELTRFQSQVMNTLHKFKTISPQSIKYKSHQRSVYQLQTKDGIPLSGPSTLKAKYLGLKENKIEYPPDIITDRQRREYDKKRKTTK